MFKALRVIRILTLSKVNKALKTMVKSLTLSMPTILNLVIFAFSLILILALVPMKYLKGKYYKCYNLDSSVSEFVITKEDCFDLGGNWIRMDFHWDNILQAIFNLFIVANCEGKIYKKNFYSNIIFEKVGALIVTNHGMLKVKI